MRWKDELSKYDWGNIDNALAVIQNESSGVPSRVGTSGVDSSNKREYSVGLFQINVYEPGQGESRLRDIRQVLGLPSNTSRDEIIEALEIPANNIKYAHHLYSKSGWQPWLNTKNKLGL